MLLFSNDIEVKLNHFYWIRQRLENPVKEGAFYPIEICYITEDAIVRFIGTSQPLTIKDFIKKEKSQFIVVLGSIEVPKGIDK